MTKEELRARNKDLYKNERRLDVIMDDLHPFDDAGEIAELRAVFASLQAKRAEILEELHPRRRPADLTVLMGGRS